MSHATEAHYTPRLFTIEELRSDLYQQLYAWQVSETYDEANLVDLAQLTWARGHTRMSRLCKAALRWRTQFIPLVYA